MPDDPKQVSYTIGTRLLTSGKVAVVMHLYREGQHALTSTLMTCDRRDLPGNMWKCRAHLKVLGIPEITKLPSASGL